MEYNTAVIGAGIAGMSAAMYLKRAGIESIIFESSVPGGQLLRTSCVENYPGVLKTDGASIAVNLVSQINELNIPINYQAIKGISKEEDYYILENETEKIKVKNIIIATGRNYKQLSAINENKFQGKGISYCAVCDGTLYKDKEVAVVGAGDSAFEEALYLSNICSRVTIIARSGEYKAKSELKEKVNNKSNIEILQNKIVKSFNGLEKLESITIIDVNTKKEDILTKEACFIFIGQAPNTDFLEELKIERENNYIITDSKMNTNINNIYAIGDCRKKEIYQLVSAASDALIAANQIIRKK